MRNLAVWKNLKFESVFVINLFLHDWFFINLQMSNEWKFDILNTAIIFCLICSSNINNFFLIELKPHYQWLLTFLHFDDWWDSYTRTIMAICLCDVAMSQKTEVCLGLITNIRFLSFSDCQAKFNWVSKVY